MSSGCVTTNDTTHSQRGIPTMTKFMLVATIASLSIVNAGSAWAQAAIGEPGAYAFYHPNGDVLHAGSGQYGSRSEPYGAIGGRNAMATVGGTARGHKRGRSRNPSVR
jgi:hypothetical protein